MTDKIITAEDAAKLVHDGDTVTTSGFVGIGVPDALLAALGERYEQHGAPGDITLLFAAGQGDGKSRGLNRLSAPGLVGRVIGGHWGLIPALGKRAVDGEIDAYNFPQGVISHLYRDIAAGKPGTLSHVGLDTFVDPRHGGGKINERTTDDLVELMSIGDREWLFYKAMPIHVALLRGSSADERGNITFEREALVIDNLSQAMAVRNSGGVVIVQVDQIVAGNSLPARDVVIPGALVDAVVVAPATLHEQTYATRYSPYFTGRYRAADTQAQRLPLDARKIIARRVAQELPVGGIVNLGIGMPEGVASVAQEEKLLELVTLTAEPGVIGGQPASGLDFGAATNIDALVTQSQQFDLYDGGGLDMACLGMAQVSACGDVNVSHFGPRLAGAGGFINISQNARHQVFAGTFSAGGLDIDISEGQLSIREEGRNAKFVETVDQITFSGARAARLGQPVMYITERCVFRLNDDGLALVEVAPGIDIERDVLAQLPFDCCTADVAVMDGRLFVDQLMDLKRDLLHLDIDERIALDHDRDVLFIDLSRMRIRTADDLDVVETRVKRVCEPLGRKIDVVVNYEQTDIDEDVQEGWASLVERLETRYYRNVSRYASSAFLRRRLGRSLPPDHQSSVFASRDEAFDVLRNS